MHEILAFQHRHRKPRKAITIGTDFLDSLLDHGMMESIKICRFKTFLENVLIKNLPVPCCSLLRVKNCVLHIDILVEFAFDSCVEIFKFLKSGNTTESDGNTLSKLHRDTSLFGKVSRWNLSSFA